MYMTFFVIQKGTSMKWLYKMFVIGLSVYMAAAHNPWWLLLLMLLLIDED